MVNAMRGEARIVIDGREAVMRLSLGALAGLEEALGEECLADLVARFERGGVNARDLIRLIGAGLRGAGESVSDAEVAVAEIGGGAAGAARAAAELLSRTFAPLGDQG